MKRSIFAVVVGIALWIVVASLLNLGLRFAIPGYAAAEPAMTFTLGMMLARLGIGAVTSLAAGAATAAIAGTGARAPWVLGAIMLALMIPTHIKLWNVFPVWYHASFLLTLVPLVVAGARLPGLRKTALASAGAERRMADEAMDKASGS